MATTDPTPVKREREESPSEPAFAATAEASESVALAEPIEPDSAKPPASKRKPCIFRPDWDGVEARNVLARMYSRAKVLAKARYGRSTMEWFHFFLDDDNGLVKLGLGLTSPLCQDLLNEGAVTAAAKKTVYFKAATEWGKVERLARRILDVAMADSSSGASSSSSTGDSASSAPASSSSSSSSASAAPTTLSSCREDSDLKHIGHMLASGITSLRISQAVRDKAIRSLDGASGGFFTRLMDCEVVPARSWLSAVEPQWRAFQRSNSHAKLWIDDDLLARCLGMMNDEDYAADELEGITKLQKARLELLRE